jgi:hypothetical protein
MEKAGLVARFLGGGSLIPRGSSFLTIEGIFPERSRRNKIKCAIIRAKVEGRVRSLSPSFNEFLRGRNRSHSIFLKEEK